MGVEEKIPVGFIQIERTERFMGLIGPWYSKEFINDIGISNRILGLLLEEKHTNLWGSAHGGLLVTMADSALGYSLARAAIPTQKLVTVSITSDFLSSPKPGDWIEAHVNVLKVGARMSFGECFLKVNEKIIFRSSGVFAKITPKLISN